MDTQTFISKHHNAFVFFREFVFSSTAFTPVGASEVEFADGVVLLGDALIVFQMKERTQADAGDVDSERRWFNDKVVAKGTRQVRDTLGYLASGSDIWVPNERGDQFNLAANQYAEIFKVVLYDPSQHLPEDCARRRHHISRTAGFIHVMDARDYFGMTRVLRVPREIIEYFQFREEMLTKYPAECAQVSERALAGHFIEGAPGSVPTMATANAIDRITDPADDWNIGPLLGGFRERIYGGDAGIQYYEILREFAKLPRSCWRAIKERVDLCLRNVREDKFAQPYRFAYKPTDCGFVFASADSELSSDPDWKAMRTRAAKNFAIGHKYDQRLSKCISVLVSKDGEYIDIQWCLISHPWEEDAEVQKWLDEKNPFRPVEEKVQYSFYTRDKPVP